MKTLYNILFQWLIFFAVIDTQIGKALIHLRSRTVTYLFFPTGMMLRSDSSKLEMAKGIF